MYYNNVVKHGILRKSELRTKLIVAIVLEDVILRKQESGENNQVGQHMVSYAMNQLISQILFPKSIKFWSPNTERTEFIYLCLDCVGQMSIKSYIPHSKEGLIKSLSRTP